MTNVVADDKLLAIWDFAEHVLTSGESITEAEVRESIDRILA